MARVAGSSTSTTLRRVAKRAACENEHGAGSGDERLGSVAGIEESARAREPDETPPEIAGGLFPTTGRNHGVMEISLGGQR